MKRVIIFVVVVLAIISLISLRGVTGYAAADVAGSDYVNIGVSAIGLVIVALLIVLRTGNKVVGQKIGGDVWDDLARAEAEWQAKRR